MERIVTVCRNRPIFDFAVFCGLNYIREGCVKYHFLTWPLPNKIAKVAPTAESLIKHAALRWLEVQSRLDVRPRIGLTIRERTRVLQQWPMYLGNARRWHWYGAIVRVSARLLDAFGRMLLIVIKNEQAQSR